MFLRLLIRAGNRRNLPIGGILVLLSLSNVAFHLSTSGWLLVSPLQVLHAALALIVLIECVIAGRVVPVFTVNVTPGLHIQPRPRLEQCTMLITVLALLMWVVLPANGGTGLALSAAAALHAMRLVRWQSWVTHDRPILWILHAAYLWMPVGFALLGAAQWGLVSVSVGIHALMVGVTGGFSLLEAGRKFMKRRSIDSASTSFSKARSATPDLLEWVTAPPSSSAVTTSPVAAFTSGGPPRKIVPCSRTITVS